MGCDSYILLWVSFSQPIVDALHFIVTLTLKFPKRSKSAKVVKTRDLDGPKSAPDTTLHSSSFSCFSGHCSILA